MAADPNRFTIVAAFGAIYFLWGGTYLGIALGIQSIPPFLLMGSRSIIGGAILLLPVLDYSGQPGNRARRTAPEVGRLVPRFRRRCPHCLTERIIGKYCPTDAHDVITTG